MGEPLHDIDKLFQEGIDGHTEYPSKKVWDQIEAGLDRDTAVTYRKKYYSLKRAAVILLILFLGVVTYLLVRQSPGDERVAGAEQTNGASNDQPGSGKSGISTGRTGEDQPGNPAPDPSAEKQPADAPQSQSPQRDPEPGSTIAGPGELPDPNHVKNKNDNNLQAGNKKTQTADGKKTDDITTSPRFDLAPVDSKSIAASNQPLQKTKSPVIKQRRSSVDRPGKNRADQLQANVVRDESTTGNPAKDQEQVQNDNAADAAPQPGAQRSYARIRFLPRYALVNDWQLAQPGTSGEGSSDVLRALKTSAQLKRLGPWSANRGLAVQAFFQPGVALNNLEDDEPHRYNGGGPGGPPVQDHDEIKSNENRSTAMNVGLRMSYGLTNRLTLVTGISFIRATTAEKSKTLYAERDNSGRVGYRSDCSSGYTYLVPESGSTPSPGDKKTVSNILTRTTYVSIPVEAQYRFGTRKFGLWIGGGGQLNFLRKGTTAAVFDKGSSSEKSVSATTEGLKNSYFSLLASLNGEWRMSDRLSLVMGPSGQFAVTSINQGASVSNRPTYFGLSAGLKLKL